MKINTCTLTIKTDKDVIESSNKFRGYIANNNPDNILLHHHIDNILIYSYPQVQYGVINGTPYIFGIDEGVQAIKELNNNLTELQLTRHYNILEKQLTEKVVDIKTTTQQHKYKFISPWIGLNQKNYQKYKKIDNTRDKKILLNKILIGNILSMCKGLGIIINHKINIKTHLNIKNVKYKSVYMQGFTGEFLTNFSLPDYMGLGKGVSQGHGTIIKLKN